MLELAGVPVPPQMEGQSLLPLMRREDVAWRSDFLFEHLYPEPLIRRSAGVIGGRYTYLRYLDPNPNYESLYDLATDPNETTDLARDPRYQSVLETLRARYEQLVAAAR
jgi:arylsulfatase A-like enzyme